MKRSGAYKLEISLLIGAIILGFVVLHWTIALQHPVTMFSYVYDRNIDIGTGDIMLFQGNALINLMTFHRYTHVGVVIVLDNERYIFQLLPEHKYPSLTKITNEFLNQSSFTAIKHLYSSPHHKKKIQEKMVKFIEMYKYETYHHTSYIRGYIGYLTGISSIRGVYKHHCSNIIYKLLLFCGVVPNRKSDNIFPWHFKHINTTETCSYSQPIRLLSQ